MGWCRSDPGRHLCRGYEKVRSVCLDFLCRPAHLQPLMLAQRADRGDTRWLIWSPAITGLAGTLKAYVRARGAFGRVNGFLKSMIEAIADSKMRRIEREIAIRGYRYDRSSKD